MKKSVNTKGNRVEINTQVRLQTMALDQKFEERGRRSLPGSKPERENEQDTNEKKDYLRARDISHLKLAWGIAAV